MPAVKSTDPTTSGSSDLKTACSAWGTAPDTNRIPQYSHVCAALNVDLRLLAWETGTGPQPYDS